MAEPISNPTPAPVPESSPEKTFTQEEVDAMIGKRLAKAMKGMPSEDELTAYRSWKEGQAGEKERWDKLTGERDSLSAKLGTAESERDQLKREVYVLKKGLTGDEAEFIAFKAGKMVDDKTTFEQAVDALTADRKKTTFDWTAPVGGGKPQTGENDVMNALIRGALK
ncbi:MAG: hypothetical protein UEY11_11805 [Evtepia gabavorous]|uniref:hypothetical protein n=1 Tax=Evtepia gabavorous TaxID=2211183 RepID=UPI002E77D135|nr:hypothetical protein [Evtepia gabavorous]MEE0067878.1 hypothetical protein [Evtepia gabavorous]